jgi:hypothetical protein
VYVHCSTCNIVSSFYLQHCACTQLIFDTASFIVLSLISGFRRDVNEICGLLWYYAASCGNCLPTFRNNVSVPSSRVKSLGKFTDGSSRRVVCMRACIYACMHASMDVGLCVFIYLSKSWTSWPPDGTDPLSLNVGKDYHSTLRNIPEERIYLFIMHLYVIKISIYKWHTVYYNLLVTITKPKYFTCVICYFMNLKIPFQYKLHRPVFEHSIHNRCSQHAFMLVSCSQVTFSSPAPSVKDIFKLQRTYKAFRAPSISRTRVKEFLVTIMTFRPRLFWKLRDVGLVLRYRRFRTTLRSHLQGSSSKKNMGQIGYTETPVTNYNTPRNIPEEQKPQPHRGGSLKSPMISLFGSGDIQCWMRLVTV